MYKLIALALMFFVSGCSTLINGTSQEVTIVGGNFQSTEIEIVQGTNMKQSSIPAWIQLYPEDKNAAITVTTKGDCVSPYSVVLRREIATAYWLNIFNIVGFFIDDATGAMWQFPDSAIIQVSKDHQCLADLAATTK